MSIIPNTEKHSKEAIIYAISYGLERASYYGVRSFLALFMINSTLKINQEKAIIIYGWLTGSVIFFKLFGALLGDLIIGNKKAILIGGTIQALGCFLLCFQTIELLYIGIGLIVLGSGMFSSNVLAEFGKQYLDKRMLLDGGFTGLILAINIGTLIGVLILGYFFELNFNYGFIFGGVIMVISTLFVFMNKQNIIINKLKFNIDFSKRMLFILSAIIISTVFWVTYESSYTGINLIQSKALADISFIPESFLHVGLYSVFAILASLIFAPLWSYIYTNPFFKLFLGLLLLALSFFNLLFIPENPDHSFAVVVLFSVLLIGVSEVLISPIILSIITRFSNLKYIASILAIAMIPTMFYNKLAGNFRSFSEEMDFDIIIVLLITILMVFVIISFILFKLYRKEDRSYLSKEAKDFLNF